MMTLFILSLSTSASFAQDTSQQFLGTVTLEQGQPPSISWPGGYQAVLKSSRAVSPEIEVKFQVFENTCNDFQGQRCTYHMQISDIWSFLVWSNHPEPEKVGKQIYSSGNLAEHDFNVTSDNKHLFPVLGQGLMDSYITCEDYQWLPKNNGRESQELKIARWGNEYMVANQETGLSENRTISGAINVNIQIDPESHALTIRSMDALTVGDFGPPILTFGDNFSWSVADENGDLCQVAFKPEGIQAIAAALGKLESQRPDHRDTDFYYYGSDERFKVKGNDSILDEFIRWKGNAVESFQ